jgi:hypothetical protein
MGEGLKQTSHLIPTLGGAEPEMGDEDTYRLPCDLELCIDSSSRFAARHTEVKQAGLKHTPTSEQHVPIGSSQPLKRHPGDGM